MSTRLSHQGIDTTAGLIEHAVFGLDRWLRRYQGVYEYTSDPDCLFRVNRAEAERALTLSDRTFIRPGDPILNLHLWNEHIQPMSRHKADLAWGRRLSRGIGVSLSELAHYLALRTDLADIVAVRADMHFGTTEQSQQLARIAEHYGFEPAAIGKPAQAGTLRQLGENVLMLMLVLAANPVAARTDVLLSRHHTLVYLSRIALERRYGVGEAVNGRDGDPMRP